MIIIPGPNVFFQAPTAGSVSYDLREGFEGSNNPNAACDLTGWTADGTFINPNYTTAPLKGVRSLQISSSTAQYMFRSISGSLERHFYWRWKANASVASKDIVTISSAFYYENDLIRVMTAGANSLAVIIAGAQIQSDINITMGNEYHMWIDWIRNTTTDFYISSNGTKPLTPTVSASAAQVTTLDANYFSFRCLDAGIDWIFDDWILNNTTIGDVT